MLIKVYYKSVDGAIIVYDITDENTFESFEFITKINKFCFMYFNIRNILLNGEF